MTILVKRKVCIPKDSAAFSGFAVNDLAAAKDFYQAKLGLIVREDAMGLWLQLAGGAQVFIYQKPDHVPASFTILNFPVDDIDATVDQLVAAGVSMEHYELGVAEQDDKGVLRGKAAGYGPDIVWFKDPAGNVVSVLSS